MRAIALGTILLWFQIGTAAPVTWGFLPGSQWTDGSPISGTFTWDAETLTISNVDIWTGVSPEHPELLFNQYGGFHYTEMLRPDALYQEGGYLYYFGTVGRAVNDPGIQSIFMLDFIVALPGPDGARSICVALETDCIVPVAHMSDYAAEWICAGPINVNPLPDAGFCDLMEPGHLASRGDGPGGPIGSAGFARLAIVPIPAAAWLFVGGLAVLGACWRRA